jgi:hypothetical protein
MRFQQMWQQTIKGLLTAVAALPPHIPIPSSANTPLLLQENTQGMIDKSIQDQEGKEHLPEVSPEIEYVEEGESGRNNDEDGAQPFNPKQPLPVANNNHPVAQPNQNGS